MGSLGNAEKAGELREQPGCRGQLDRGGRGLRDRTDGVGVGAGEAGHQPRVGPERDHLPGWERPVVLGDGEILVDDAAALERDIADDAPLLQAHGEDEGAHPVRDLPGESTEHLRLAVGQLVVGGRPAIARRQHDAARRPAGKARDELAHGPDDAVHVVGLHVDGAERELLSRPEVLLERGDRRPQHPGGLGEAGADPGVAVLVGGLDLDEVGPGGPRVLDQPAHHILGGRPLDMRVVGHQP